MGRPRLIILVRHAQSEGNKNRAIHQTTPDHKVKLTPEGHRQARGAGTKLLSMLRPDDTVQIYTSPYLRTRETTQDMLMELQSHPNHNSIKVYEEPRIREQDFGNFQPCAAEMERIWHERAAYGHFFYRIPNGESAADAYDRVSGFNESLWRQFAEPDFPSVLVLVTHGLMTRIFLMKWYHYSVEYFEDLRNVNHCEFVVMERNDQTGKYLLQTKLRTWSDYKKEQEQKRRAEAEAKTEAEAETGNDAKPPPTKPEADQVRRWGGCVNGCSHAQWKWFTTTGLNENGNCRGDLAVESFQAKLKQRFGILQTGRDFGGSKSGAPSDCEDSTSGEEDGGPSRDEKDTSNSNNGVIAGNSVANLKVERPRAEVLGDESPVPAIVTECATPTEITCKATSVPAGQLSHYTFLFILLLLFATVFLYTGGMSSICNLAETIQDVEYKRYMMFSHFHLI